MIQSMPDRIDSSKGSGLHPAERSTHLKLGRWRFSSIELLIALALIFVATPFVQAMEHGQAIESVLMTVMLVSAVLAIGGRRRVLLVTAMLAAPAIFMRWFHHFRPDLVPLQAHYVTAVIFLGFVILNLLRFVLRTPRVDAEVLCASISAYLLLGLLWTLGYLIEAGINPGAFILNTSGPTGGQMDSFNAFYFSFVTLSTVGYGDITPVSRVARMLAITESMTGLLYVAVLIARLVSVYSAQSPTTPSDSL